MSLLTGLLLACGGGVFAVACNRRRIELVMPAAMMCNALVLYFCFLLGFPRLGAYAVFGVNLALLAAGLLRARRDWHGFLRRLLTPGFAAFCLWSLIAYIITRYRVFSSWDEFTHWGSVAKAVYMQDKLSYAYGDTLEHAYYPPGMSVWQYFYCCGSGGFSESAVMFATNQLLFSFLTLPLMRTTWRNWRSSIWYAALIMILPSGFISEFYAIYVDSVLALVMGYGLCVILLFRRLNWVRMWYLLIALGFLALVKDSGKGLGMLVLAVALVQLLCDRQGRRDWRHYVQIVLPCAAMMLTAYSWKYLIELYECHVIFSSAKISFTAVWDALFNGKPDFAPQVVKKWLLSFTVGDFKEGMKSIAIVKKRLSHYGLGFIAYLLVIIRLSPLIQALLMSGVLLYLRRRCRVAAVRKNLLLGAVMIPVLVTLFAFTLLIYYIFSFTAVDALRLASFDRYTSTVSLACYLTTLALGVWAFPRRRSRWWHQSRKAWFIVLLMPLVFTAEIYWCVKRTFPDNVEDLRGGMDMVKQQLSPHLNEGETLALVDQASFGEMFWQLQYDRYPALDLKLPYSVRKHNLEKVADGRKNSYAVVMLPDKYFRQLLQNQVVYCNNVDDYFRSNYGKYFADPLINGRVYRLREGKFYLMPLRDVVLDFDKYNYMEPLGVRRRFRHSNGKLRFKVFEAGEFISGVRLNKLITVANGTWFRKITIKMSVEENETYFLFSDGSGKLIEYVKLVPGKYEKVIELQPRVLGQFKLEFFTETGTATVELDEIVLQGEWSQNKDGK